MEYVDSKEDPLLQIVRTHQHNKFKCYRQLGAPTESYRQERDK